MKRTTVFFLVLFFILCSLAPTIYELARVNDVPQNRFFELVHNYVTDYHFYLSRVREGWEGRTTVVERYTSEPHEGSFIQVFYLGLGQISRIISDPVFATAGAYHMARIVFGALLLIMTFQVVKRSFHIPLWQILSFLLAVTAATWPKVVVVGETWRFGGYMAWWTIMDSLQRITFLPHILLGQSLIVFLLLAGSDRETLVRRGNWVFLGILTFLLAIVFPPGYVFVGVVFGFLTLFDFLWDKEKWMNVWPRLGILCLGLPGLIYFQLMFGLIPWQRLIEIDTIRPLPFRFTEYAQVLGPTLPLGLLGMIVAVLKRDKHMVLVVSWVLSWIGLLFVFQFIPSQNPSRFSEMVPQIALGILTAYVFAVISNIKYPISLPRRKAGNIQKFTHILKFIGVLIPIALITLGLGIMYSSWLWQRDFVDMKVRAGYPQLPMNNYIVYPTQDIMDGIFFIGTEPLPKTVFAGFATSNLMPAYTNTTVYLGHDNTVDGEKKQTLVKRFFSGNMAVDEALEFLKQTHITHIFIGPEESDVAKGKDIRAFYPFLTNPAVFGSAAVYNISSL